MALNNIRSLVKGDLHVTGSVSGSATTTGSFGHLEREGQRVDTILQFNQNIKEAFMNVTATTLQPNIPDENYIIDSHYEIDENGDIIPRDGLLWHVNWNEYFD